MPAEARYFIPVYLHLHTKYRTAAGVQALFDKYALHEHDHLMVIADRLLVLDRLMSGRYWTVQLAISKANQEAQHILKLINRMSVKTGARTRGRIVCWNEIAETTQYTEFSRRLQHAILSDQMLAVAIQGFVERAVRRYDQGSLPERARDHEREYILSEASMRIFCTEVLGFSTEVWERPPQPDAPDPLTPIYAQRRELIGRLTGHDACRVLTFLFPDAQNEAKAV